jgi:hypothetical protein
LMRQRSARGSHQDFDVEAEGWMSQAC